LLKKPEIKTEFDFFFILCSKKNRNHDAVANGEFNTHAINGLDHLEGISVVLSKQEKESLQFMRL